MSNPPNELEEQLAELIRHKSDDMDNPSLTGCMTTDISFDRAMHAAKRITLWLKENKGTKLQ